MRDLILVLGAAGALASCGGTADNAAADNAAANTAAAEKPKPAYCFFKDDETKAWTAKAGKDGNVLVSGKAYRSDARYKAILAPATVSGTTAEIAPTLTNNDTGFASPDNWWDVSETIPNSQEVGTVVVKCGSETIATLSVPRKK